MFLPQKILEEKLKRFLAEDIGQGDITTALLIPSNTIAQANVVAREAGVIAGIEECMILLESVGLQARFLISDGEKAQPGEILIRISGNARTILSVERTLLNLLSRMSGITTATRHIIEKLESTGIGVRVACTRKTAPGLLYFDKKAVFLGGGDTHRLHLDDMILIKDNHIAIVGNAGKAVREARKRVSFSKKIEAEVSKVDCLLDVVKAKADIIMLDNFSPKQVQKAIKLLKDQGYLGKALVEVSGGVTSDNVEAFAIKGVDIISLGEITNNASPLDIGLEITKRDKKRIYNLKQP